MRRTRQAPAGPPGPGPTASEECPEPLKRRGPGARPAPPQNEPALGCRSALNSGRESSPLSHPYLSKRVPPPQAPGCLRSGGKTTTCHHHRHSKMADISALASPPLPPPWLPIIPSQHHPPSRHAPFYWAVYKVRPLTGSRVSVSHSAMRLQQGRTRMGPGSRLPVGQLTHGAAASRFPPSRLSNKETTPWQSFLSPNRKSRLLLKINHFRPIPSWDAHTQQKATAGGMDACGGDLSVAIPPTPRHWPAHRATPLRARRGRQTAWQQVSGARAAWRCSWMRKGEEREEGNQLRW